MTAKIAGKYCAADGWQWTNCIGYPGHASFYLFRLQLLLHMHSIGINRCFYCAYLSVGKWRFCALGIENNPRVIARGCANSLNAPGGFIPIKNVEKHRFKQLYMSLTLKVPPSCSCIFLFYVFAVIDCLVNTWSEWLMSVQAWLSDRSKGSAATTFARYDGRRFVTSLASFLQSYRLFGAGCGAV